MKFPESKWNIGDYLYRKQDIFWFNNLTEEQKKWDEREPVAFMVLGIRADSCYAATQINYQFRVFTKEGATFEWCSEIELTDSKEKI